MLKRKIRIVMLCRDGWSSKVMFNGLSQNVIVEKVILEDSPAIRSMVLKRIKKLGLLKTIGQLFFLVFNKLLIKLSKNKMNKLISNYGLNNKKFPDELIQYVDTINCQKVIRLLKEIRPDVVLVNGTRIISDKVLSSVDIPFINTHMGITPKYRGVHGGYWALVNGDKKNCGVTIHIVDKGIDTGGIIYQCVIDTDEQDNFNTYPIHQIAKAIPIMNRALIDIKEQSMKIYKNSLPSYLWYHPTLVEYFLAWFKKGVK